VHLHQCLVDSRQRHRTEHSLRATIVCHVGDERYAEPLETMFSWLSGSNPPKPNHKSQPRCANFIRLEATIREARHQRKAETSFIKLHSSYSDLESCASQGCIACRVVRQGLLLAQITGRQVEQLEKRDDPVYVRLMSERATKAQPPKPSMLQVILGVPQAPHNSVDIALTTNVDCPMLPEKRFDVVVPQIKAWLNSCCANHEARCGNLAWSTENPRRLIEIVSDDEAKLIDASSIAKVDYVALSYCWGGGGMYGNTTWEKLPDRQNGFSIPKLPETIRDTLVLVRRLGLKYVWIDQVCIVQPDNNPKDPANAQGEDWDLEGSRMHIVYGNALFTLNACSSEASTDGLFRARRAWTYPVSPFYLDGQWLVNFDTTLKEVRARAPLSSRAWVLQEERLSPRLLYFCGQRFYWSCSVDQHMEIETGEGTRGDHSERPLTHGGDYETLNDAQAFLAVRFEGDKAGLHREWQDLVESYCVRNMTKPTDRFRAISGLAAQYLRVHLDKDNKIWGQEYLAGLWRTTFAKDLAWSVRVAASSNGALGDIAPTWSWASLPLCTRVSLKEPFESIDEFSLLEANNSNAAPGAELDAGAIVLEACRRGADKKSVIIKGRIQRLMNTTFTKVDWPEIQARGGTGEYSFAKYIDQYIYARDAHTGKMVIHEPTKRSMEAQLDYLVSPDDLDIKHLGRNVCVAAGTERDLWVLQIGKATMLVLRLAPRSEPIGTGVISINGRQKPPVYRRVGICRNVRDAFFDGVEPLVAEVV
jgi:hypothetical protein